MSNKMISRDDLRKRIFLCDYPECKLNVLGVSLNLLEPQFKPKQCYFNTFPQMLLFVDRISKLFTAITPSWVMESIWIFLWRYLEVFLWSEKIPQSSRSPGSLWKNEESKRKYRNFVLSLRKSHPVTFSEHCGKLWYFFLRPIGIGNVSTRAPAMIRTLAAEL